mgnify:CR=1 FL=1
MPLPAPVYRELVDTLFSMWPPILGLGLVFAGVAGLAAGEWGDPLFAAIAIGAVLVTAARLFLIDAYRREVLEKVPFDLNTNDFAFDTQFLAQAVHFGFKVGDIPVPVRYFDEASSIEFVS